MRSNTTLRSVTVDDLTNVLGGCKRQQPPPQAAAVAAAPQQPPAADGGLDVAVKVAHGPGAAAAARGAQSEG